MAPGKASPRWHAILMVLTATLIWGGANTMNKMALDHGSPSAVLLTQLTASVIFLAVVAIISRLTWKDLKGALPIWWTGILEPGLTYIFGITGLETSNASVASIILSSEAALVVIIVAVLGYERPSTKFWFLSFLSLFGVSLVVVGGIEFQSGGSWLGAFLIFLATLSASLYAVFSAELIGTKSPLAVVVVQQAVSLLVVVGYSIVAHSRDQLGCILCFSAESYALISLSGILQYAIGFLLFVTSLKILSAAVASAYLNAIPLFGLVIAALVLGERMSPLQWVGSLIAIAALIMISFLRNEGISDEPEAK